MRLFLVICLFMITLSCKNDGASKSDDYPIASYEIASESPMVSSNLRTEKQFDDVNQKLIKESYLKFETRDLDKTYKQIIDFVKQNDGYVQSDNTSKNYNRISRSLIVRIPSKHFDKTIDSIENNVPFFDEKRISSRDVTEEFIDLEARLKAKKTLENRYLDLLSKAKNVKEILEIERELSKIREEIEAKLGRLKYLENRVDLSTLNIEFYKITSETGVTISYGAKMWNAIKSGFIGLSIFFLGLLRIWPFLLILVILILWFKRWFVNRRSK